jgi:pimeloyl-ACP methyl ester carboxylesterase/DNA-binding CsgD family transcriptional regulator
MGHPIGYARTRDGVNIAFTELGRGEPLIYLTSLPWSNFAVGFSNPLTSLHPEEVARAVRLIVYDARGCGLSDHGVADLTLDGFARDIDAVAEATGHERFSLYGSADASRVMIHYAATHPERVKRLVLWVPSVSASRLGRDAGLRMIASLAGDWELYIRTVSHAVVGSWDADRAPYAAAWADVMRASIRQDEFGRFREAMRGHDVSADLPRVQAPTLVLGREDVMAYTVEVVREVAAGIPSARLVVTPGNWLLPCTGDDVTREVVRFMRMTDGAISGGAQLPEPRDERVVSPSPNGSTPALSTRELEVLALLAEGMTNAQIAEALVVAPATVSRHVHNLLNKLGMNRRAEAAVYAARHGLAESGSTA